MLIDATYIEALTGIAADKISEEVLMVAHATAKQMLGYLEEEEVLKTFYTFTPQLIFSLDDIEGTIEKVEFRVSSEGEFQEIVNYRHIASRGLLIFDAAVAESTEVQLTITRGWTAETVTDMVKYFITLLSVRTLSQFDPGLVDIDAISTRRIGDFSVTYANDYLASESLISEAHLAAIVVLIKQGVSEPTAQM